MMMSDELSQVSAAARTLPAPPSGFAVQSTRSKLRELTIIFLTAGEDVGLSRRRCTGRQSHGHIRAFLNERYRGEHAHDDKIRNAD